MRLCRSSSIIYVIYCLLGFGLIHLALNHPRSFFRLQAGNDDVIVNVPPFEGGDKNKNINNNNNNDIENNNNNENRILIGNHDNNRVDSNELIFKKSTIADRSMVTEPIAQKQDSFSNINNSDNPEMVDQMNSFNTTGYVNIGSNVWVYSTFMDQRLGLESTYVRSIVLVARNRLSKIPIECRINRQKIIEAELYEFCENHAMLAKGYFASCKVDSTIAAQFLKNSNNKTKVSVELRYSTSNPEENWTKVDIANYIESISENHTISNPNFQRPPKHQFTVCTPTLFAGGQYDELRIVEFIELTLLLGANHIFIYVSMPHIYPPILRLLRNYENKGVLTLLNSTLPVPPKSVWNYGQMLIIEDCLYRNMGLSKYVLFNDIDEFLVPQLSRDRTWPALVERVWPNSTVGGMGLPTAYFPLAKPQPPNNSPTHPKSSTTPLQQLYLTSLHNTQQKQDVDIQFTKCIVRPRAIFEMGIHHISRTLEGFRVDRMRPTDAMLHHYKNCSVNRPHPCRGDRITNDVVPKRFGEMLITKVNAGLELNRV